jgi:ribosomal protein L29
MAIIKRKQLKDLSSEDVKKRLAEMRLDLAKDRAQISVGGSPPNSGKTREKRRLIARMLTMLNTTKAKQGAKSKKEVGKTA